jgi:hypothetical protein
MASWVPASTTEFWTETAECVYLGGGQWELLEFEVLTSSLLSPIAVAEKSVWGIKLSLLGADLIGWGLLVAFENYGDVELTLSSEIEFLLDVADRDDGEYVKYFEPGAWRGEGYSNVFISNIELYTDWVDTPEPSPCRWTSFVGSIEVCE